MLIAGDGEAIFMLPPKNKLDSTQVQVEPDGSVELDSIQAQFPGITGIKYRNPATQVCTQLTWCYVAC